MDAPPAPRAEAPAARPAAAPELARLATRRRLARLALLWEAVWPRAWPVLGVLGGFVLLALLEVPARLPRAWHWLFLAAAAVLLVVAVLRAARGLRAPTPAAADRRLERVSGLRHRPLAALTDRPAGDDPAALALWRVHQARAAAALRRLRVGAPRPGLPARDRHALRGALAVGLLAALGMAGSAAPARLARALWPGLPAPTPAAAPRLEAWVTPPTYTGAAPVFLDPAGGSATVPVGSRLQVALSGAAGAPPELVTGAAAAPFRALDAASFTAEAVLTEGGAVAVRRGGAELARWTLAVQADAPPTAAFAEPPARAPRGLALRLPWRAEDDWGLAALRAELRLIVRPAAPPLVLELPLPGGAPRTARGTAGPDLSAHPWAGLEVEARLVARDGAGQEGGSEPATITLPERAFNHPVARQLVAIRRDLSRDPEARGAARTALEAVAAAPEAFEHDAATYLAIRTARTRLGVDRRPEAVAEVQDTLWETALALEEGRDGRTLRALQQARDALREALREAEQSPEDRERREALERRAQELREAIRRHLEALAERLQRENAEALPFDPRSRMLDGREADRRTERLREAAREGRTEDARRELAELEEMLRALEEGRAARAETPERRQRRERGQQGVGVVQDMVRRESEMLDRSHQRAEGTERERAQERAQARRQPLRNQAPPQPPAAATPQGRAEAEADARRQRALRRALGELMQQHGDLTGEVPEALGRADQAMRDAAEALREGGDPRDAQQRAMRALQEGGRQMAQQLQRQFGRGQGEGEGEGEGEGDLAEGAPGGGDGPDTAQGQGEGRDPLGRRTREANGSAEDGADTRVPEEAEQLRTRRIQEELRRRGAERERPAEELDYIDRLLKRF